MNTKEYEQEVWRTMGNGNVFAWTLGLMGEAGEVADLIKKLHFHGGKDSKGPIMPDRILNEAGDVLWYLAAFLRTYGFTLEECMEANVRKLRKRHPNGFTFETAQAHADEKRVCGAYQEHGFGPKGCLKEPGHSGNHGEF